MNNNAKTLENALIGAWGISLIATLGSLYFSEILKFIPCDLCWFQRIFMYPQVVLLGLAAIRKEYGIARYSLALSIIGGAISLYHYALQKFRFSKPMRFRAAASLARDSTLIGLALLRFHF